MAKPPFARLTEKGLNGTFLLAYTEQSEAWLQRVRWVASTNQRKERYPGLGTHPKMERDHGEQNYETMADTELTVENFKYSGGIIIPRDEYEDDKTGQQRRRTADLGREARDNTGLEMLATINANSSIGYDGQPLFSATHRAIPGDSTGPQSNIYASGSGSTADDFRTRIYGARGFMRNFRDDRGRRINKGMRIYLYVHHPDHDMAVDKALGDPLAAGGETNTLQRQTRFVIIPVSEPDMPNATTSYMFGIDRPGALPMLLQEKRGPETHVIGQGSEWFKEKGSYKFGAKQEFGIGPWAWTSAARVDHS